MDEIIAKLTTPERCELALNVDKNSPERAKEARRRAVELRAAAYAAKTDAEREALEAVYAYEWAQSLLRKKTFHASRTWPMIRRLGVIAAVERIVKRPQETEAYRVLIDTGMRDKAFEAVVLCHPEVFSSEAVQRSRLRLQQVAKEPFSAS
jgi:hypothetical protein